jgi:hypothetical protein
VSGKAFISYRRDDSSASAGRLYDRLITHFPSNQIFMDVDNLDPGVDFVKAIEESVGSCDVLIAVIGRRWLISSDEEDRRRLDNSEDFVRIEIATALKRGIRVIPVLVEGVSMPRSGDLPDDLRSLLRRHALEVSHTRFRADSERLIGAVERALEQAKAEQRQREEKERLEAERREREEKERFDALRREREEKQRLAEYDASGWAVIEGFNDGIVLTAAGGSFPPNGLGIYDLGGNVWEWCQDDYEPGSGLRVLRGGSWGNGIRGSVLSSNRFNYDPDNRYENVGFRAVVEAGSGR